MSTDTPADYRASLREQLAVAGPAALDMLNGSAALDVPTLVAAAQAAGLLDHVTVGEPALRTLRRQLVEAIRRSPLLEAALEQLDLSATAYKMTGLDLDDQQEVVALVARALEESWISMTSRRFCTSSSAWRDWCRSCPRPWPSGWRRR